jgi:hypothetical protein
MWLIVLMSLWTQIVNKVILCYDSDLVCSICTISLFTFNAWPQSHLTLLLPTQAQCIVFEFFPTSFLPPKGRFVITGLVWLSLSVVPANGLFKVTSFACITIALGLGYLLKFFWGDTRLFWSIRRTLAALAVPIFDSWNPRARFSKFKMLISLLLLNM